MPVTMQDIATDLKVSVVTVSKVLRHKGNISTATRNRVLKRAKELNYQMNWVARSLVTRRTYTIGLLLPDFRHPFFGEIAKAVAETVRQQGYHVIISYFEEDAKLEATEAESLVARQVDGLIVASAQAPGNELFKRIQARKVPFILIDRPIAGTRASFVGTNNEAIGKLATEHLIAQGCRRIAHLRGPAVGIAEARLAGYRRALAKHKLDMPAHYVVEALYDDDMGYRAMQKLLRTDPAPDGIFCYNDPVAIGAMKAIFDAGLNVPGDIAVIGAGNVHYSDMLAVPLSTIDQGTVQIGTQASEILMEQITSKRTLRPKTVLITPKLVVRKSTERMPAAASQRRRSV
jgi:LacI family transcriptional regulator